MVKAAQTKQPAAAMDGVDMQRRTGMAAAQAQMNAGGSRYPYLRLNDGDRARFHFLTNGDDLLGSRFHQFGEGKGTRHYLCLRVFTGGEESCKWCEQAHDNVGSRFVVWVFVHNILHAAQTETAWKANKVGDRTLFREEVKQPLLIRMAAGKKQSWFSQFVNAWTTHGDLQRHIYELHRVGEDLDTEYHLTCLEERVIPKNVLENEEVQKLPNVEQILREEISFGPAGAGTGSSGVMGTDAVLGEDSASTAEAVPEEAQAVAEEPAAPPDDDLI